MDKCHPHEVRQRVPAAEGKASFRMQPHLVKRPKVVSCLQGDTSVDRVIRFMVVFCTHHPSGREDACMQVVEALMGYLLGLCVAVDKAIRFRVCQLLAGIFNNLPESAEITEELADDLQAAMLLRMKDKVPQVRSSAVRALSRLADPGEVCYLNCLCHHGFVASCYTC